MEKQPSPTALEIVAGILLSIAGTATSWSGYQATLWSGIQAESYSRATTSRLRAALADAEAGQMRMIDTSLFMQWLNAHAENNADLENFYRRRFREEFVPAFDAWIASAPIGNPNALPSPLAQPEYKLKLEEESAKLEEKGASEFQAGQDANTHSDHYVLNTVIFGLVMFFAGMSQQFHHWRTKKVMLAFSVAMTLIGFYNICTYPMAALGK